MQNNKLKKSEKELKVFAEEKPQSIVIRTDNRDR